MKIDWKKAKIHFINELGSFEEIIDAFNTQVTNFVIVIIGSYGGYYQLGLLITDMHKTTGLLPDGDDKWIECFNCCFQLRRQICNL